jgi:large subunit ribosomal protein L31
VRAAATRGLHAKEDLLTHHPETHLVSGVCATCGTPFALRSTAPALSVDVCSSCHPAYTGAERAVATGSRIERFSRRQALAVS